MATKKKGSKKLTKKKAKKKRVIKKKATKKVIDKAFNDETFNKNQKTKLSPEDEYYDLTQEPKVINIPKDYTKSDIDKLKERLDALSTVDLGNGFKVRLYKPKIIFNKKW